MTNKSKIRRGRPPKNDETMLERINIRAPSRLMDKVRAIQAERLDGPDTAQVVRELLAEAVEARESAN